MPNTAKTRTLRGIGAEGDAAPADGEQLTTAAEHLTPTQRVLAQIVTDALRDNSTLNYRARAGLAVFSFSCCVAALAYAVLRTEDVASVASGVDVQVLAATLPVLVLILLATFAGIAAWTVHARGLDEMYGTLDAVTRLEREGEVAVSSRGLVRAFEEKLQNTRRAFTLLLWLGRTLFIVCLGLAAAAIISLILDGSAVLTGALGAGSLLGLILGIVKQVPRNVAHHLADVIQIQTIITGSDRQISLLETAAFAVMNHARDPVDAQQAVLDVQAQMDRVVSNAVRRIEQLADPEFRDAR